MTADMTARAAPEKRLWSISVLSTFFSVDLSLSALRIRWKNHFRFLFLICVQRTSKSKQLKRTHMNVIWIMVHGNGRALGMWWRVAGSANAKAMPSADSVRISSVFTNCPDSGRCVCFRCWLWCVCSPLHQINISPTPTRNEIFYVRTEIKRYTLRSIYLTDAYTIHMWMRVHVKARYVWAPSNVLGAIGKCGWHFVFVIISSSFLEVFRLSSCREGNDGFMFAVHTHTYTHASSVLPHADAYPLCAMNVLISNTCDG